MLTGPTFFADALAQLILFVKQSAWLNTIPEKQKRPRRATRGDTFPPLAFGRYLIEILFEIGPVKPAGMGGTVSIDEQDIYAWQCNQGIALSAWEARALRVLSREYSHMLSEASAPDCPPPYVPEEFITAEKRKKIADAMTGWADKLNQQRKR